MISIPSSGRALKRSIAFLLFHGLLFCSTTDSFVLVNAYQAAPSSAAQQSLPTVSGSALEAAKNEGPMECTDEDDDTYGRARQIMYNQLSRKRESVRYQIIAAESCEPLAKRMAEKYPDRFTFHPTKWAKFPDGTDNIEIGGFSNPRNVISGEKVLFLASFHNNDTTLSQFQVMICLLQSFIESLTVVLPFSPVGTMERVTKEGQVATAATYAHSK